MYALTKKSKENQSRAIAYSVGQHKQSPEFTDNRVDLNLVHARNASLIQRAPIVVQMGGGSHYWRKEEGGAWIYSGKFGTHKVATSWHVAQGYTNGKGWQFSQGGKKNPPGT